MFVVPKSHSCWKADIVTVGELGCPRVESDRADVLKYMTHDRRW